MRTGRRLRPGALLGERPREGRQGQLFEPLRICFAFRCEINNRISQSSSGCLLIAVHAACDDSIPGRIERGFEDGKRFRTEAFAITGEPRHLTIQSIPARVLSRQPLGEERAILSRSPAQEG